MNKSFGNRYMLCIERLQLKCNKVKLKEDVELGKTFSCGTRFAPSPSRKQFILNHLENGKILDSNNPALALGDKPRGFFLLQYPKAYSCKKKPNQKTKNNKTKNQTPKNPTLSCPARCWRCTLGVYGGRAGVICSTSESCLLHHHHPAQGQVLRYFQLKHKAQNSNMIDTLWLNTTIRLRYVCVKNKQLQLQVTATCCLPGQVFSTSGFSCLL